MERYTDVWDNTFQDLVWDLPCEPGVTFECTQNVMEDIILFLPHMFRRYKNMYGAEMAIEIDDAYYDTETYTKWYRVNFKNREKAND